MQWSRCLASQQRFVIFTRFRAGVKWLTAATGAMLALFCFRGQRGFQSFVTVFAKLFDGFGETPAPKL